MIAAESAMMTGSDESFVVSMIAGTVKNGEPSAVSLVG